MRYDAPFLVKRYGPPIGRPDSRQLVSIDYHAYSLAEALAAASSHFLSAWRKVHRPSFYWIERKGQPAVRVRRRARKRQRRSEE